MFTRIISLHGARWRSYYQVSACVCPTKSVCVCACVCGARTERNVRQLAGPTVQKIWFVVYFFWATVTEGSGPAARQSSTWSWIPSLTPTPNPPLANCINQRLLHSSVFWVWGLGSGVAAGLIDILVYRPPCWRFPPNCRQFMEGSRRVTSCVRAWQQLVTLPPSLSISLSLFLLLRQTAQQFRVRQESQT